MVSSDVIVFRGIEYRRYPESLNRNDRVYYKTNGFGGTPKYLHVDIYESIHGPITSEFHVHNIDGNPLNNDPSNLIALLGHDHLSNHSARWCDKNKDKVNAHLDKIRPLSAKWHGSPEGLAWHRENGKKCWKTRTLVEKICEYCGKNFKSITKRASDRFCSNKCKSAWRRKSGVDDIVRTCVVCTKEFSINRYKKTKICSRECHGILRKREGG